MDRNLILLLFGSKKWEVALRKESVDRNASSEEVFFQAFVALRKESVDRNLISVITSEYDKSRSPQGERG